jgi:hypothetical protein
MLNELLTVLFIIFKMSTNDDSSRLSSKLSSEIIIYNIENYLTKGSSKLLKVNNKRTKRRKLSRSFSTLSYFDRKHLSKKKVKKSHSSVELSFNENKPTPEMSYSSPYLAITKNQKMCEEIPPSISACFYYDESFESKGRNNSAKDDSPKKKKNFFKRIFKRKTKEIKPKIALSNLTLNESVYAESNDYYIKETYHYHPSNMRIQKDNSESSDSNYVYSNDARNSITTKLTITDELNRTKLVAESSPEVENYKHVVETTVRNLQSVQELMVENLKQLYERDKQLDSLEEKANVLKRESSYLQLTTKQVKSEKSRCKHKLILIVTLALFVIFIVSLALVMSNLQKSNDNLLGKT